MAYLARFEHFSQCLSMLSDENGYELSTGFHPIVADTASDDSAAH